MPFKIKNLDAVLNEIEVTMLELAKDPDQFKSLTGKTAGIVKEFARFTFEEGQDVDPRLLIEVLCNAVSMCFLNIIKDLGSSDASVSKETIANEARDHIISHLYQNLCMGLEYYASGQEQDGLSVLGRVKMETEEYGNA